jgi:hypothetical protein
MYRPTEFMVVVESHENMNKEGSKGRETYLEILCGTKQHNEWHCVI